MAERNSSNSKGLLLQRSSCVAGFEWGTGFYINPVPPEQGAGFLRETKIEMETAAGAKNR